MNKDLVKQAANLLLEASASVSGDSLDYPAVKSVTLRVETYKSHALVTTTYRPLVEEVEI